MALDLGPSFKLHGIRLPIIKLLGLMHHDTRHLSISDLNNDLYLPITVATPRKKSKQFMRPQKVKEEQYLSEPPIWMQSMMEWMMQSCQQPSGKQAGLG